MKWHTTIAVRAREKSDKIMAALCLWYCQWPMVLSMLIFLFQFLKVNTKYQWYSRVMWYCRGLDSGTSSSVQGGCVVCGARLGVAEKSG